MHAAPACVVKTQLQNGLKALSAQTKRLDVSELGNRGDNCTRNAVENMAKRQVGCAGWHQKERNTTVSKPAVTATI